MIDRIDPEDRPIRKSTCCHRPAGPRHGLLGKSGSMIEDSKLLHTEPAGARLNAGSIAPGPGNRFRSTLAATRDRAHRLRRRSTNPGARRGH